MFYQRILDASATYTRDLEPIFYNADKTVTQKIAATATYLDMWLMRRTVNYIRVGYSTVSYKMWTLFPGHPRQVLGGAD